MIVFILISLFVLGLLFGSFSSVIIERIKFKKSGIVAGRSECPQCKHILSSLDLFPLFSWIFLRGKCRYCKTKISPIYPLLELTMALFFTLGGYFFVNLENLLLGSIPEMMKLGFILLVSFVTTIFIFYDIRFTEIPDEILIPAIFIIFLLLGINEFYSLPFFSHIHTLDIPYIGKNIFLNAFAGMLFVYTFFYLQILIPGLIYTLKNKKYKIAFEICSGYVTFFGWLLSYLFHRKDAEEESEEEEAIPSWIGGGDLRIAVFMGLILGFKLTLIALFLSYIIGSIVGIGVLLKTRERGQIIPFGPFLGMGLMITLFWNQQIFTFVETILTRGIY